MQCECADPGCRVHPGRSNCREITSGECVLYRVDMVDLTGTMFCEGCADDAMESGLFTYGDDEEDEDEAEGEGGPPYDAATASGMYDHDDGN